jgi:hydrogenase 3 maturation protease
VTRDAEASEEPPLDLGTGFPVVVLGIGSSLRGDDAAGLAVAEALGRRRLPGVHALSGGTAPENLTGEIRQLAPARVILVDAADFGGAPGALRQIAPQEAEAGLGTHSLPLAVLAGYLAAEIGCRVFLLGIQPRSLAFGEGLSPEVRDGVAAVVRRLASALASHRS